MRYHNFFAILKLYLWSIHMANNLILAIFFGFKLNSNLKITEKYKDARIYLSKITILWHVLIYDSKYRFLSTQQKSGS